MGIPKTKEEYKQYTIDEDGKKYIMLRRTIFRAGEKVGDKPNMFKVTTEDDSWTFSHLAKIIPLEADAEKVLYALDGLTDEELKIAYNNDLTYSGYNFENLIKLGKILAKASSK
jgi:protease II